MKRKKSSNKQLFLFSQDSENIQWERLSKTNREKVVRLLTELILSSLPEKQFTSKGAYNAKQNSNRTLQS